MRAGRRIGRQAQPGRALLDQPDAGAPLAGAAQLDAPARRPGTETECRRPWAGARFLRRGGRVQARQARRRGDAPARARRAGMAALGAPVEKYGGRAPRRRCQLQAARGLEIERVDFRQHGRRRACPQRFLAGPDALFARAGFDREQARRIEAECGQAGRMEACASRRDPDHWAMPREAGQHGGGEARCCPVFGGSGNLVQAAREDAAAQPGVERGDAERQRPVTAWVGSCGRRTGWRGGLDRADPRGEFAAPGGLVEVVRLRSIGRAFFHPARHIVFRAPIMMFLFCSFKPEDPGAP